MLPRTLVLLLSGWVCLQGAVTHAFAQDAATERHGFTAGLGFGSGWVSPDLCPPQSCNSGIGVRAHVGWVWRKDVALVVDVAGVNAGGTGTSPFSGPIVDASVRGAAIRYWPRARRGWLSAGAGRSTIIGRGTVQDEVGENSNWGVIVGAGWELWRNERRMAIDFGAHTLAVQHRTAWVRAAILSAGFNWYQVRRR